MKRTLLSLIVVAQFAAAAGFAQTVTTDTTGTVGTTGTADTTATADTNMGASVGSFGSDWSSSMGTALMGDDGMTIRTDSEIATQWQTLSDEDKGMIRRDCMAYMQMTGAADTTTQTDTTTQADTTTTTEPATGTADATTGTGTTTMMTMTAEQMDKICAATKGM